LPNRTRNTHLYELAKRGAEVQFRNLVHEAKLLIELFPHLRDSFDKDELPLDFIMARQSGGLTKQTGRRRRRVSAAERKAISTRMKKYWARRKATKNQRSVERSVTRRPRS
jgi:hypothetical protein